MADQKHNSPAFTIDLDQAAQAWQAIRSANQIAIISHRHPDPDTVGANLALRSALTRAGLQIQSFCVDAPPETCQFLEESACYQKNFQPDNFDLIISVDCGGTEQVAFQKQFPDIFKRNFINIDHHASNQLFGTINIVQTNLSSTCEIVYQLLHFWELSVTTDIANYLLFGLYYDTGSFMHPNTTPAVLEIASDLVRLGARLDLITKSLFQNFNENKFHLWGQILEKIKITADGNSAAAIPHQILAKHQAGSEELSGLTNYLSMVKGSKFAVLVSEEQTGQIRGSLRSVSDEVDLSKLAQSLGGGGHRKASGFSLEGHITEQPFWSIQQN